MKKILVLLLVVAFVFALHPVSVQAEGAAQDAVKQVAQAAATAAVETAKEAVGVPVVPAEDTAADVVDEEFEYNEQDDAALLRQAAAALKATNDPKNTELAVKLEEMAKDYEW